MDKSSSDSKEKRTINFNLRLTKSEHEQLKKFAGGHRIANFIRDKCLNRNQARYTKIKNIDPKLTQQLARIGNNLNQLTKTLHTNLNAKNALEVLALASELDKIKNDIAELKQEFKS